MSIKKLIVYLTLGEIITSSFSLVKNDKLPFQKIPTYEVTVTKVKGKGIQENLDNYFKEKNTKIYLTKPEYERDYSKINLDIKNTLEDKTYNISDKDIDKLEICKELFYDGKIKELTNEVFNSDLSTDEINKYDATLTYTDINYDKLGKKEDNLDDSLKTIIYGLFIGLYGLVIDANFEEKKEKIKHIIK